MAAPYVVDGYLTDGGYVYQPVVTGMTTNWLFRWNNTSSLTWDSPMSANRTWQGAWDVGAFTLDAEEVFLVAENQTAGVGKSVSEAVAFSDERTLHIQITKNEALALAELGAKNYSKYHAEAIAIAESLSNDIGKNNAELFVVSETLKRTFGLNQSESIAIAESYLRSAEFVRDFSEVMAVIDAVSKTYGINKSEALRVVDAWRRQGDLVISDMVLSAASNPTMDDFISFMSFGNVPGYEEWRDFIPGDYEYREAMFRVVLESKNADRGILTNLQATVDVPDLIDRGTATVIVAETGALVTYNRTFHIVPEITLAARGGTGNPVAPEFNGNPTKDSFNVRLRDTVTGKFVTGSFTWAAHGY